MTLFEEIYQAGREITSASETALPGVLNNVLGRYFGWPLKVGPGYLVDLERKRSSVFASVIYAGSPASNGSTQEPQEINADNAAAVIDVCETLDLAKFSVSYARIAETKRLKKRPPPQVAGVPVQTTTLGVIFALRATVSLDLIAEELVRMNTVTPSSEWPAMVVVATTGTVNYAAQFPGEPLIGDLLPPGPRALDAYTPPMYVVVVMTPSGSHTPSKMLAFLVGQLFFFSPGMRLPDFRQISEGVPKTAITVSSFQYNLAGALVRVPSEFYNDRYLPPLPFRIEDRNGALLCSLQFLPWQDGGAILSRGRLPLDAIMPFLMGVDIRRAGKIKRDDCEISYVLPMTVSDFNRMLERIQQQTNMVVRREEPRLTIQKVADEGTQTPFIARLFLGALKLRDLIVLDEDKRKQFDALYDAVLSPLRTARKSAQRITQLWLEHSRKVSSGEVARLKRQVIEVDESIDDELRKEVESFVITAARAMKDGMHKFSAQAQVDIGFLFQKQAAFEAALETTDAPLADYIRQTRTWSVRLQQTRISIEQSQLRLAGYSIRSQGQCN